LVLKQEGFDNSEKPGGIHLARSLIDRLLAEKEAEQTECKKQRQPSAEGEMLIKTSAATAPPPNESNNTIMFMPMEMDTNNGGSQYCTYNNLFGLGFSI
jgi:hypothetical protein